MTTGPFLSGSCHSRCLVPVRLSQHLLFIKHFPATILSLTQGGELRAQAGCVTVSALLGPRPHHPDTLNKITFFQCTKRTYGVIGGKFRFSPIITHLYSIDNNQKALNCYKNSLVLVQVFSRPLTLKGKVPWFMVYNSIASIGISYGHS